jgi:PPOX class probable FMN-dependent enzyme
MADAAAIVEITTPGELTELVGEPIPRVRDKVRPTLHEVDRAWLAGSPLCMIATADANGSLDVSPKGDPAGFTLVLDDTAIVLPDRPGNRRVDGFRNVLANPRVGLIFLVPGRPDTLRINGRARLLRDAPFFDDMIVGGNRPTVAMLVDIEEVFYHCPKAFLRSGLWRPESWQPDVVPSRAAISKAVERPEDSMEELERYYGEGYAANLYD